jgi:prepilin-type N-terminal cleavage/methylation domain-containing protein
MAVSRRVRTGFTLVELLVVITIIGMLMALIFPAFGSFLAQTRKTTCQKNIGEIAKAVQQFESKKLAFPGWLHRMETRRGGPQGQRGPTQNVSWHVAVLEYLQESQHQAFKFQQITTPPYLSIFVCPVDTPEHREAPTSYVANCGMKDATSTGNTPPDWQYNGIFHKEVSSQSNQKRVKMTSSDIKDGRTLMITENIQADRWWAPGQDPQEANVGVVFFVDKGNPNEPLPTSKKINVGKEDTFSPNDAYNYARPSSNHSEGVCVAYADGSAGFLLDRVPYGDVYVKIMTPDGARAMEAGSTTPLPPRLLQPLDESLLQ